ncbi:hypothetical protein CA54_02330 [Symmachiella macrocystis]|uniref:Gram-positive cocci surface proteins LPxTG domain-containing protein n=1 Tax=Symmachiella macrocystis TaxID=2527985 RepID=A0A5C6BJB3_9PLAN|nr:hypothetical protein [Symmachiella macrocystis]TWU11426.1 hypothetical protein CA54_02330 [Symmachiella macrocystis]
MQFFNIRWAMILCVAAVIMVAANKYGPSPAFAADATPPAEVLKPADAPVPPSPVVESNNQVFKITLAAVCGVGVALAVGSWILFRKRPS